jgi:hypothetical protein
MGWDRNTSHHTVAQVVAELRSEYSHASGCTLLANHYCRATKAWYAVVERNADGKTERHLVVVAIERLAAKHMDESMHPYYYGCPLNFLGLVPECCKEWRDGVRQWHTRQAEEKAKARSLCVGEVWSLAPGVRVPGGKVRVVCVDHPGKVTARATGRDVNGRLWRIRPRHLGERLEAPTPLTLT